MRVSVGSPRAGSPLEPVCSVMETSPSVCEVMCVESIQQYSRLCSIQLQQVIWEVAHSFRLQECEPAIHMEHTEPFSNTHIHTRAHTSICKVFATHAEFDIEVVFFTIFKGAKFEREHFEGFGMELVGRHDGQATL